MHRWGDWPDALFEQVDIAAEEIGQYCRRWGRIQVRQTKEKFGTARVYCSLSCENLHELVWPGYVYIQYPKFYRLLTFPLFSWLRLPMGAWQRAVYRRAYRQAIAKYPEIREEILQDADWPEYLEGL